MLIYIATVGGSRAGLNEREAPGKLVTASPPKRLAKLRSVSQCFNFAKAPVETVRTDTIW